MGKTFRNYKGNEYPDKSLKKKACRKSFMLSGDRQYAKANGGIGLKRGWAGGDAPVGTGYHSMGKIQYQGYLENPSNYDEDIEDNPL